MASAWTRILVKNLLPIIIVVLFVVVLSDIVLYRFLAARLRARLRDDPARDDRGFRQWLMRREYAGLGDAASVRAADLLRGLLISAVCSALALLIALAAYALMR